MGQAVRKPRIPNRPMRSLPGAPQPHLCSQPVRYPRTHKPLLNGPAGGLADKVWWAWAGCCTYCTTPLLDPLVVSFPWCKPNPSHLPFAPRSAIVYSLIPNVSTLEHNLSSFAKITDADEVVLFERATFLVISSATQRAHHDVHRCTVSGLRLVCRGNANPLGE